MITKNGKQRKMTAISATIKLCKVKKMPPDVEDLIFEYLGRFGFAQWYNWCFIDEYDNYKSINDREQFLRLNYVLPDLYLNLIPRNYLNMQEYSKNNILLLNLLWKERLNMPEYSTLADFDDDDLWDGRYGRADGLADRMEKPHSEFLYSLNRREYQNTKLIEERFYERIEFTETLKFNKVTLYFNYRPDETPSDPRTIIDKGCRLHDTWEYSQAMLKRDGSYEFKISLNK